MKDFDSCKSKFISSVNIDRKKAHLILKICAKEQISPTLLAVTWLGESGLTGTEARIINNPNDGQIFNVDIGPGQINYKTFSNWLPLYGEEGKTMSSALAIWGANLAGSQPFNGSIEANLSASARILKSYGGGDRNRAGLYRTGAGKFRESPKGIEEYNKRAKLYNTVKDSLDRFFLCLLGGK